MPEFIDISQLTKKSSATGNEEFQVSATEKVTAQQIANLAPTGGDPQDAKISKFTNTGSFVIPESVLSTQSIVRAIQTLAVLAGDNPGHRIKNFTSYIDKDSYNPINVTIFEVIDGTSTAGVYFGPNKIGFGVFTNNNFDETLTIMVNDLEAYSHLKAQGFWTKEINVADLGGGGSTSNPLDAIMNGWDPLNGIGQGNPIIGNSSTLGEAFQLIYGKIANGKIRVIVSQDYLGVVEYNQDTSQGSGFVFGIGGSLDITILSQGMLGSEEFVNYTDEDLAEYIYSNGNSYQLTKLSNALTSQKSLNVFSSSTGTVSWNTKYKVNSQIITIGLPSVSTNSHNASDTIEIWSSGGTTINLGNPGGVLIYIREGDQTQPTGTLYKKTTITNPWDYYYFVTVDYFKSEY